MVWNIWGKIKDVAGKVWGKVKPILQKALPIAQTIAPAIANAFAPGSGGAVAAGLGVANSLVNGGDLGDAARRIFSKPPPSQKSKPPSFNGMFGNDRLQPQLRDEGQRVSFDEGY
jgi:hypothetical protein